jgi:hypothetical protein
MRTVQIAGLSVLTIAYGLASSAALCALAVAVAGAPGWYYGLLRAVVCGAALVGVAATGRLGGSFWPVAFGALAALFNPIAPIYLHSRDAWIVIDLIASALFIGGMLTLRHLGRRDPRGEGVGAEEANVELAALKRKRGTEQRSD